MNQLTKEKRVSSKLKQKQLKDYVRQLETKFLEEQTKRMQEKLAALKKQVQEQKKLKAQTSVEETLTRWHKAVRCDVPMKSYAQHVLEEQKTVYKQLGINEKQINGAKSFEHIKKKLQQQKEEEEHRTGAKIPAANLSQPEEPVKKIEMNLTKAKIQTRLIREKTLAEFLTENYLQESYSFGALTVYKSIYAERDKAALEGLGVKTGHQVKIIKKIKEYFDKQLAGKHGEETVVQVPAPQKKQFGQGDGNVFEDPMSLEESPQMIRQMEEDDAILLTAVMDSTGLQAEEQEPINCYECYQRVYLSSASRNSNGEKIFCGQLCHRKYLLQMQKQCPACKCRFEKTEGIYAQGYWFCSIKCSPSREEAQGLFLSWKQQGL